MAIYPNLGIYSGDNYNINDWPFEIQGQALTPGQFFVNDTTNSDKWTPNQVTAWDQVILGEFVLPGISKITGLTRNRKYQIVKNKETHYGDVKDLNLELAQFSIENTIIDKKDLDYLIQVIQYFEDKVGVNNSVPGNSTNYTVNSITNLPQNKKGKVVVGSVGSTSIEHPLMRIRGISSVFITGIEGPVPYRVGKMVTTFKCLEVRKPIQSTSKNVKPKSSVAQGDAFDDVRKQDVSPDKDPAVIGP
jgi:hypothetical protein